MLAFAAFPDILGPIGHPREKSMIDISAAIVVLAGAVMLLAAARGEGLSQASRQRLAGFGYLVTVSGAVIWLSVVITELLGALVEWMRAT